MQPTASCTVTVKHAHRLSKYSESKKPTCTEDGATKFHHIEGAAKATEMVLSDEELTYLEEPYVPHPLAGVMAQNKPASSKEKHVWSTGDQRIER